MDPAEPEIIDQPTDQSEEPEQPTESDQVDSDETQPPSEERFYYFILDPNSEDTEAYYVDPEDVQEGEFVAAAEEAGGSTGTSNWSKPSNSGGNRNITIGGRGGLPPPDVDNFSRGRSNANTNLEPFNRTTDGPELTRTTGRTNLFETPDSTETTTRTTGRTNLFDTPETNESSTSGTVKPSIFGGLGERIGGIFSFAKTPVSIPELVGPNYQVSDPRPTVGAMTIGKNNYPEMADPRTTSKHPVELVEIFDKADLGNGRPETGRTNMDTIDKISLTISPEVDAAIRSISADPDPAKAEAKFNLNRHRFRGLLSDVVMYRMAGGAIAPEKSGPTPSNKGNTFQQKAEQIEKIKESAIKHTKVGPNGIAFASEGLPGFPKVIKPMPGKDVLWTIKVDGKLRPMPPFDMEVIAPGLIDFLDKPSEWKSWGSRFLDQNGQLTDSTVERIAAEKGADNGFSATELNYTRYTRDMEIYAYAKDVSERIAQRKEAYKGIGGDFTLDVETQQALYDKFTQRSTDTAGLIDGGLTFSVRHNQVDVVTGDIINVPSLEARVVGNPYNEVVLPSN